MELLLAGVPIERVSILLGHQSVRVTEKHYNPWVRSRQEQLEADVASAAAPQNNERVGEIRLAILTQRIRAAYSAGAYADVIASLDVRAGLANEQIDLMVLRGWSYYHLQRYEEAARVFEAIAASGHDEALSALGIARSAARRGGRG